MQKTNNIVHWCQSALETKDYKKFIEAEGYSILGNRKSQQDFAGIAEKKEQLLAVVCDGMGGMQGGELASRLVVQNLIQDYQKIEVSKTEIPDFFKEEAVCADRLVSELEGVDGQRLRAGTTMVAVMMMESEMQWISIGDSRIYLLREQHLIQLTRDHNYKERLKDDLKEKKITEQLYDREIKSKKAEALTSYLGINGLRQIDMSQKPFALQDGDQILLCSDGIYKSLGKRQIEAMLVDNQVDTWIAVKRLVNMAWQQAEKRQDNATAVLLSYHRAM